MKNKHINRIIKIEKKIKDGHKLTKNDLCFIYEIDPKIRGFDCRIDQRIKEIIETRNPKQDILIIFECEPSQIAYKQEDINKNTKVYIGPLFKGIFQTNLENIYTSFPEGKIREMEITIGGKTKKGLIEELKGKKITIAKSAQQMMDNKDFTIYKKQRHVNLVRLTVEDLGFSKATAQEIYSRAKELGLELCPAEIGPGLRLNYLDQPEKDWLCIAMKPIVDADDYLSVFFLGWEENFNLWLCANWAYPGVKWVADKEFVFRLRKSKVL